MMRDLSHQARNILHHLDETTRRGQVRPVDEEVSLTGYSRASLANVVMSLEGKGLVVRSASGIMVTVDWRKWCDTDEEPWEMPAHMREASSSG